MTVLIAKCEVEECTSPRIATGLCHVHYARKRRNGHTDLLRPDRQRYADTDECLEDGCTIRPRRNGLCSVHSQMRHGMSRAEVDAFKDRLGGLCWLCQDRPGIDLDHDHSCCPGGTGCRDCVRGFVCRECNLRLRGKDDQEWSDNADAYLEEYRSRRVS